MKGLVLFLFLLMALIPLTVGQTWEIYNSENSDLPEGDVNALFVDAYGGKWFATNQGLAHFIEGVWNIYTTEEGLASNVINGITGKGNFEETQLYISTPQGVSEISYDASGVIHVNSYNSSNSGLNSDSIACITLDTGLIYYGSQEGLDTRTGESWMFLDQISTIDGDVSLQQITSMSITPHGWNYVGTSEQGVARLHLDLDGVTGASSYSTEWSGLLSDNINDIYINEEGNQWYATDKGLAFHEGYETKLNWDTYTELSSELISNKVHTVSVDDKKTTWAGTDKGISRFDGFSWLSFTSINEVSDYAVFDVDFDLDGTIWFASDIGVLHHDETGIPDGIGPEKNIQNLKFHLFPTIASHAVNLQYDAPPNCQVSVFVMDLDGRIVAQLVDHRIHTGPYKFTWNIKDMHHIVPGSYIICVQTEKERLIRKIIIVR